MASVKKASTRQRPVPVAPKGVPDVPSPAIVSGATAPLRVFPPPAVPDPEVRERAARRRFTADTNSKASGKLTTAPRWGVALGVFPTDEGRRWYRPNSHDKTFVHTQRLG